MVNYKKHLKILFDLQPLQTLASKERGIGRYTEALFSSMSELLPPSDVFALLSDVLSKPVKNLNIDPRRQLNFSPFPSFLLKEPNKKSIFELNRIAYSAFVHSINPDVIYCSHIFEGFDEEKVTLPNPTMKAPGQIFVTTLYDLIPLRFKEHYFKNKAFEKWYLGRAQMLHQFDLILSISDSSREDAIKLLKIDPSRIVTIYGGTEKHFQFLKNQDEDKKRLKEQYGLQEKIVIYCGGNEYRKNLNRAIQGFAQVPPAIRQNTTFVIICSMCDQSKKHYLDFAYKQGLKKQDILFTGFISNEDLFSFYRVCDLCVFPSLYEGLGFPVLEGMISGAPVIGGNNSSIKELINNKDALFDASSTESIANAISKALTNQGFLNNLRQHGLEEAKKYSWERTATLALNAIQERLKSSCSAGVTSVVNGWVPKKRLAFLSPLPPDQSGIAHYNAEFLPFLSRYFEIDIYIANNTVSNKNIYASFPIYHINEFEKVAHLYENAILYEFGNSEFHTHMIRFLGKFPGIVMLHDAYLSGLFYHSLSQEDFLGKCLKEHGTLAGHYMVSNQKDAMLNLIMNLPCTKSVLDHAIGVISHSPFNLEVSRQYHPEGWKAPFHIIPQMIAISEKKPLNEVKALKRELNIPVDATIIATFGHVDWTKLPEMLIEAFSSYALKKDNIYLIFVGKGFVEIKDIIKRSKVKNNIKVTEYLSDNEYQKYLDCTDLAVQLRVMSRGGTPRAILDCLANGVPVIVNNAASFQDYPDDVVIKLSSEPSVKELLQKMDYLFSDQKHLEGYRKKGIEYIKHYNEPNLCAGQYAATIHAFIERHKQCFKKHWVPFFYPHIGEFKSPEKMLDIINTYLDKIPVCNYKKKRILIDVSHICIKDWKTGVQRVVKEIVRSICCSRNLKGYIGVAFKMEQGKLVHAKSFLEEHNILCSEEKEIQLQKGDILLMLDSSQGMDYMQFKPIFEQAKNLSIPINTVIYDLIPINYPQFFDDEAKQMIDTWFRFMVSNSNQLICISKACMQEVSDYLKEHQLECPELKLNYFHLGANPLMNSLSKEKTKVNFSKLSPYLLFVGTFEPRKRQTLALDALEILWKKNIEINLVFVGREGHHSEKLMKRLKSHSMKNKKLFFFKKANDLELNSLYKNAEGLLFLSLAEGFGLPLFEAANYGLPILCSDLPVFREIAGEFATYLDLESAEKIAEQIEKWWDRYKIGEVTNTKEMPRLTWDDSAHNLIKLLLKDPEKYENGKVSLQKTRSL